MFCRGKLKIKINKRQKMIDNDEKLLIFAARKDKDLKR